MEELRPDHIMAVGAGYANAKVLLSAVGLGLFTELGDTAMTAEQIAAGLGLVARPTVDFLDTLVSLDLLTRDGDGPQARQRPITALVRSRRIMALAWAARLQHARRAVWLGQFTRLHRSSTARIKARGRGNRARQSCLDRER